METIIGTVTTVAGVELTVKKDKHHFRAYDKDGKQHGAAWMECENLANELRFPMPGIVPAPTTDTPPAPEVPGAETKPPAAAEPIQAAQSSHDRDRCGHFKEEVCRMDNTACDGKCGEHASRATAENTEAADNSEHEDGERPNIEG